MMQENRRTASMRAIDPDPVDVDFSDIPEYNQNRPWSHLHAWAMNNEPPDAMIYKKGYWIQIQLIRDELFGMFHDRVKEISVVSTHTSKSIILPVYKVSLADGTIMIMRCNFHDWKVTVISSTPVLLNTACLRANEGINPIYCEGFDPSWVLGPYAQSSKEFTFEASNDRRLMHILQDMATPNPLISSLASALERTSDRLRSVLESKPVRDADEALEEARHLLNGIR